MRRQDVDHEGSGWPANAEPMGAMSDLDTLVDRQINLGAVAHQDATLVINRTNERDAGFLISSVYSFQGLVRGNNAKGFRWPSISTKATEFAIMASPET